MIGQYLLRFFKVAPEFWESFWFSPARLSNCSLVRVLVSLSAGLWFVSLFPHMDWYFFPEGWLNATLARQLSSATHGVWTTDLHLSPLWYVDGARVYQAYLAVGCVLAVAAAIGWGGRWTVSALCLWVLFLSQRLVWISSSVEPLLVAMLGYLIFQPGRPILGKTADNQHTGEHWTAGLSLRLMQTHWWLLILFALLLQLANVSWWQGDAVWWLAATGRSNVLSTSFLQDRLLLVNVLTHGIVLTEILALVLLLTHIGRPLGYLLGLVVCLAYALIADQTLYGVTLAASLHAYCDRDFLRALRADDD